MSGVTAAGKWIQHGGAKGYPEGRNQAWRKSRGGWLDREVWVLIVHYSYVTVVCSKTGWATWARASLCVAVVRSSNGGVGGESGGCYRGWPWNEIMRSFMIIR